MCSDAPTLRSTNIPMLATSCGAAASTATDCCCSCTFHQYPHVSNIMWSSSKYSNRYHRDATLRCCCCYCCSCGDIIDAPLLLLLLLLLWGYHRRSAAPVVAAALVGISSRRDAPLLLLLLLLLWGYHRDATLCCSCCCCCSCGDIIATRRSAAPVVALVGISWTLRCFLLWGDSQEATYMVGTVLLPQPAAVVVVRWILHKRGIRSRCF